MSERGAGFWTATGLGLAMTLSACGPTQAEMRSEERDHYIDVRVQPGFENEVINAWIVRHPNERLKELKPLIPKERFVGYTALTEKGVSGLDVFCERLPIGKTPNEVPALDKWHAENNAKTPDKRRKDPFHIAINNSSNTVTTGYIICSLPLQQQTGVK